MKTMTQAVAAVAAAMTMVAAVEGRAAVWTNLAVGSTVGGNQGAQTSLVDQETPGGRWHQSDRGGHHHPGQ